MFNHSCYMKASFYFSKELLGTSLAVSSRQLLVLHLKEDVEDVEQDPEAIHRDDLSCQVGFASSSRPCSCSLASAYGLCVVGPGGSGPGGSLTSALRSHLTVQHWREPSWTCSEEPNGSQRHYCYCLIFLSNAFFIWLAQRSLNK